VSSLKAGDEQHVYFSLEMARAGLPKAKQLAVLLACIDDSGSVDQNSMVIGGVIADLDSWVQLEPKWKRLLKRYGLPELHMFKVRNECVGWRTKRFHRMLNDFTDAVLSLQGRVIGAGLDLAAFKKVSDEKGWICDPMCLCLEHAVQKCHGVAKAETEKFGLLLDRLKKGSEGAVARLLSEYLRGYGGKFLNWMVESRLSCEILQAADFAAYHEFRFLRETLKHPGVKIAPSVPYYRFHQDSYHAPLISYFDEDALLDFDAAKRRGELIVSITLPDVTPAS
jgi:hypothetical protein